MTLDFTRGFLLEVTEVSPACPSDKSHILMKMGMEHWWSDTERRNWSAGGERLYSVGGR